MFTAHPYLSLAVLFVLGLLSFTVQSNDGAPLKLETSGLLEADYRWEKTRDIDGAETKSQNTSLSTAEIALGASLPQRIRVNLVLLAEGVGDTDPADYRPTDGATEDRPDELHVEELTATLRAGRAEVYGGRRALPFGAFDSHMLSDPVTLAIGETKSDKSLGVKLKLGRGFSGEAAAFDGNHRSTADDERGYTVHLRFQRPDSLTAGLGYLSAQGAGLDAPALANVYLGQPYGPLRVFLEYVSATDASRPDKPRGLSLDAGLVLSEASTIGLHYDASEGFSLLEDGNGRYRAISAAYHWTSGARTYGLEYLSAREGDPETQVWTARLSLSF